MVSTLNFSVPDVGPAARRRPSATPKPVCPSQRGGDVAVLARSFERSLLAANGSAATVRIYTISIAQFGTVLDQQGLALFGSALLGMAGCSLTRARARR